MPTHGHPTVVAIPIGRASDRKRWSQQLRSWWTAHQAARHAAYLASLSTRWDATREAVTPLRADAALDMVASTHTFSTSTAMCDLGV